MPRTSLRIHTAFSPLAWTSTGSAIVIGDERTDGSDGRPNVCHLASPMMLETPGAAGLSRRPPAPYGPDKLDGAMSHSRPAAVRGHERWGVHVGSRGRLCAGQPSPEEGLDRLHGLMTARMPSQNDPGQPDRYRFEIR
jgi:hypothetical protein